MPAFLRIPTLTATARTAARALWFLAKDAPCLPRCGLMSRIPGFDCYCACSMKLCYVLKVVMDTALL